MDKQQEIKQNLALLELLWERDYKAIIGKNGTVVYMPAGGLDK